MLLAIFLVKVGVALKAEMGNYQKSHKIIRMVTFICFHLLKHFNMVVTFQDFYKKIEKS